MRRSLVIRNVVAGYRTAPRLANAQGSDRQAVFRKLLGYGAIVMVLAPIVVWIIFVVARGCRDSKRPSRRIPL